MTRKNEFSYRHSRSTPAGPRPGGMVRAPPLLSLVANFSCDPVREGLRHYPRLLRLWHPLVRLSIGGAWLPEQTYLRHLSCRNRKQTSAARATKRHHGRFENSRHDTCRPHAGKTGRSRGLHPTHGCGVSLRRSAPLVRRGGTDAHPGDAGVNPTHPGAAGLL